MEGPIMLHVDLAVNPAKEKEMLQNFEKVFRPAAVKFPGFIDVKMIKLRSAVMGSAPPGVNYRFVLTYQSEELRQKWVTSDNIKRCGPRSRIRSRQKITVLLFDVM